MVACENATADTIMLDHSLLQRQVNSTSFQEGLTQRPLPKPPSLDGQVSFMQWNAAIQAFDGSLGSLLQDGL